jgi:hypothetical protein
MSNTNRNIVRTISAFILSALFVLAAIWVVFNRQFILDTIANATYQPTDEISAIVTDTKLTQNATFTFYATKPEVLDQNAFNNNCPRQEQASPILGCYTSQDRVYIYNVTDPKLNGIKEVTSVHELLHAVWFRMSEDEQTRLEGKLRAAYEQRADDELKRRMGYYERTEPGEFVNELHSILGTEVTDIGSDLEAYYSRYFDRAAVLALHAQYNDTFRALTTRSEALVAQLNQLSSSIDAASTAYAANTNTLSADIAAFNTRAANGGFSSSSQFNAERARLVARSNQLEADRQSINASIQTYTTLRDEYQTIARQVETLNKSIDSYQSLDKAPSV